ncbi:unnamed protein product [Parnassius apollo]|uniref:(apollo) hypothetical protein n=1 Tax=Parnassius apollo TaxID=110799 RepID=A0A8S3WQJ9_PARAO|nr:unnamed protein product [Parnassius apollo]
MSDVTTCQRLEDTEWRLCQRAGEIALLKTLLKEAQVSDVTTCQRLEDTEWSLCQRAGEIALLKKAQVSEVTTCQRLEDTKWSMCQRAGEIALLKTQLKEAQVSDVSTSMTQLKEDSGECETTVVKIPNKRTGDIALLKTQLKKAQNEQTAKGHEYLTLKADSRQLREALDKKEKDIMRLRSELEEKEKSMSRLQTEVDRLTNDLMESVADLNKVKESSKNEIERLKTELKELRQELSDVSLSGYEGIECGRTMRGIYDVCKTNEYHWSSSDSALEDAEVQRLNGELPDTCSDPCPASAMLERLKCEMQSKETQFNNERRKWSEEKDKVLRYQKQLQMNYVQMFKRSRTLEAEVDGLRLELELCNKNMKNINQHGKTIEL